MATPYKQRAIQRSRSGDERVEYWVVDESERIRTCAPQKWHKIKLEDRSSEAATEQVAKLRYKKLRQFNQQVDDNAWLRTQRINDNARYRALCDRAGIIY